MLFSYRVLWFFIYNIFKLRLWLASDWRQDWGKLFLYFFSSFSSFKVSQDTSALRSQARILSFLGCLNRFQLICWFNPNINVRYSKLVKFLITCSTITQQKFVVYFLIFIAFRLLNFCISVSSLRCIVLIIVIGPLSQKLLLFTEGIKIMT